MPDRCPACGTPVERPADEVMRYCPNVAVPRPGARGDRPLRLARGDGHPRPRLRAGAAAARRAADRGRGRPVRARPPSGWSSWTASPSSRPSSWLQAIEASKQQPLSTLLFGLGIRHVGKTVALLLARRFGTHGRAHERRPSRHQRRARRRPCHRRGGGRVLRATPRNRELIERLAQAGLNFSEPRRPVERAARSSGKTYVLTGTLPTLLAVGGDRR